VRRSLTQITDDVYRYDNNFHVSIVVVTDDGVVVGDPINREAAEWLEAEIEKRFQQPVKYLVISHSHADHASGGEIFEDTATVITHEKFVPHLEAGEVRTAEPDVTFSEYYSFELGGKTFALTYLGVGHGDDMIAMTVQPDNVAFIVDVVSPRRLPWRGLPANTISGLIDQLKVAEGLEFDVLIPGHSHTGTKQDVTDMRLYLETLRDKVQMELDAGKSEEEIIATVRMPDYAHWDRYDEWIELNVAGMVRLLTQ
jgi:glyoxylase-like metal-dependent hydrolase (beta-lactamase superfamily II)